MHAALIAWLNAALDDVERAIIAYRDGHDGPCLNHEGQDPEDYDEFGLCVRHLAAAQATPFRYAEFGLRQVAAHRAILNRHAPRPTALGHECSTCLTEGRCDSWQQHEPEDWPCPDVRAIASIYADRPGYDPAWAPGETP